MGFLSKGTDHSQREFNDVHLEALIHGSAKRITWTEGDRIAMKQWLATHQISRHTITSSEERLRQLGEEVGVDFTIISDAHWAVIKKKLVSSLDNTLKKLNLSTRWCPASKTTLPIWPEDIRLEWIGQEYRGKTYPLEHALVEQRSRLQRDLYQGNATDLTESTYNQSQVRPTSELRDNSGQTTATTGRAFGNNNPAVFAFSSRLPDPPICHPQPVANTAAVTGTFGLTDSDDDSSDENTDSDSESDHDSVFDNEPSAMTPVARRLYTTPPTSSHGPRHAAHNVDGVAPDTPTRKGDGVLVQMDQLPFLNRSLDRLSVRMRTSSAASTPSVGDGDCATFQQPNTAGSFVLTPIRKVPGCFPDHRVPQPSAMPEREIRSHPQARSLSNPFAILRSDVPSPVLNQATPSLETLHSPLLHSAALEKLKSFETASAERQVRMLQLVEHGRAQRSVELDILCDLGSPQQLLQKRREIVEAALAGIQSLGNRPVDKLLGAMSLAVEGGTFERFVTGSLIGIDRFVGEHPVYEVR